MKTLYLAGVALLCALCGNTAFAKTNALKMTVNENAVLPGISLPGSFVQKHINFIEPQRNVNQVNVTFYNTNGVVWTALFTGINVPRPFNIPTGGPSTFTIDEGTYNVSFDNGNRTATFRIGNRPEQRGTSGYFTGVNITSGSADLMMLVQL